MKSKIEISSDEETSKDLVISFLEALNSEDFKSAKNYLSPTMKFEGVMGTRDGADAYIKDMEKMKFKYDIQRIFVNGDDVSVFYEINMSGVNVLCSGWYHVEYGKIAWFKVIFDPRPILEKSNKK